MAAIIKKVIERGLPWPPEHGPIALVSFFYFLLYATIFKMPIKVQTCSATQNDKLNLSFVNMARNGRKWQLGRVEVVRYHRR